jgi:hypothetical protein
MIAILTGALGALLTYYLTQKAWLTNVDYQQRAAVLQKGLDLIDRTAQLLGRAPGIEDVWQTYRKEIGRSIKKGSLPSPDLALATKLGEYNGEFRATLEMDNLFFGPNTRIASTALDLVAHPPPILGNSFRKIEWVNHSDGS